MDLRQNPYAPGAGAPLPQLAGRDGPIEPLQALQCRTPCGVDGVYPCAVDSISRLIS